MKRSVCLLLLLWAAYSSYAGKPGKFTQIDARARNTGYYSLNELAGKLTAPYHDEASKVRSIFIWITSHITYDVAELKNPTSVHDPLILSSADSLNLPGSQYWRYVYALEALKKKQAVCEGYASLFQVLCNLAGLRSVRITGDARLPEDIGKKVTSDHAWNAVMIGNEWKLMDVTWASGHVIANKSKYVRKFNAAYYNIAPELMILDHYPDSTKWQLLPKIMMRPKFEQSPHIRSDTDPRLIPLSYKPGNGILDRVVGDSIVFELELPGPLKTVLVWDEEGKDEIYYDPAPETPKQDGTLPAAPAGEGMPEQPARPVKVKAPSDRNNKATNDILDDVASVKDDTPEPAAPAKPLPGKARVSKQADITGHYFYRTGNKIRFTYRIRRPGSYLLSVCLNQTVVIEYAVHAH